MDAQYPDDRFTREVLDEGERHIAGRTKQSFLLSLDKAKGIIVVVRGADGWHAAYECVPPKPLPPVRGVWAEGEFPLSQDEINRRWFRLAAGRIAEAVVLGQEAERLGIAPEDMWRNSPGEVVASLPGDVTVRWMDVVNSLCAPSKLSFYEGERLVFHVSRRLVGENPSHGILQAIWSSYQFGVSTGTQQGIADGRGTLQRELANLLSEAA